MLHCTNSIKVTNIDIYLLYQIRHVQQRYKGLSVVNIPLILLTIHVYVNLCCLRTIYAKYSNSTTN